MNIPTILAAAFLASTAQAQLSLPSVFSDHMVLQRGIQLPVWGRAPAGQSIRIELIDANGKSRAEATAQTGVDGKWRTQLPSLTSSAMPLTLKVTAGSESIVRSDVLIGEVWLCGGQSNMEMSVGASDGGSAFAASLPSTVRCFTAPHDMAPSPRDDQPAQWVVATPQTAGGFTAVGGWFAAKIQKSLDVPIGLLSVSWGGSPAEAWTPAKFAGKHPMFASTVAAQQAQGEAFDHRSPSDAAVAAEEASRAYDAATSAYWLGLQAKDPGFQQQWQQGTIDSSGGWVVGQVPGAHGSAAGTESLAKFDGGTWWRRSVSLPQSWLGRDLNISLGPIDDSDVAWVNGIEVGRTTGRPAAARNYRVPAAAVRVGSNDIAVFVLDTGGAGGICGQADQLMIVPSATTGLTGSDANPISLAGEWQWKRGIEGGGNDAPTTVVQPPVNPLATWSAFGSMFNAMMAPVATYGLRGAIWYQGESNADRAAQYRELLPLMIRAWRESWRQRDLPFGIVQLAGFRAPSDDPVEGVWAELRDAQLNTMRVVPKCGLAVTIDVGDAADIHPRNKKAVGERLAGWALSQVYDQGGEWSGPIFKSAKVQEATMVLTFEHADGLASVGGAPLGGFAVAGSDGKFEWGSATIQGSTVIVSSPKVPSPTTVRYAWSCNPVRANLINAAGLPASPFATDRPTTSPTK